MAMASDPPPDFGPIPREIRFSTSREEKRSRMENMVQTRIDLGYINNCADETHAPYTWGFTVYRAVFGPGTDERFALGIKRLGDWMRWEVQQARYNSYERLWKDNPLEWGPAPGKADPSDDLAKRLWNEVIEDYPDRDEVRAGDGVEEGDEDFSPVGEAFLTSVEEHGNDTTSLYVRNDHCLIIDERALRTLEQLPDELPEVKLCDEYGQEIMELHRTQNSAWVWILDREYFEREISGNSLPRRILSDLDTEGNTFPSWIRIKLGFLVQLWFYRPQKLTPSAWVCVVEQDTEKWDKVFWWCASAAASNEVNNHFRKRKREEEAAAREKRIKSDEEGEEMEGEGEEEKEEERKGETGC